MPKLSELKEFEIEEPKTMKLSDLDSYEIEPQPEFDGGDTVSEPEAALQGLTQGATLNLGEELGAAALTPLEMARRAISKYIPGTPEEVDTRLTEQGFDISDRTDELNPLEVYKQLRDPARKEYATAQEESPYITGASELVGGMLPAVATGGAGALAQQPLKQAIKEGAKAGAKYGAVSGLGRTEDITDVPQVAQDIATGGALGGITGGALPPMIAGAKKVGGAARGKISSGVDYIKDQFPSLEKVISASQRSARGEKLTGQQVSEELSREMDEAILGLSGSLKNVKNIVGDAQRRILKKGKKPVEISDDLDNLIGRLESEAENIVSTDASSEVNQLVSKLKSFKTRNQESMILGEDTAFLKLAQKRQRMIDDMNAKKATTLDPVEPNFSEVQVDSDTGRVFFRDQTTGKTYSQNIGADKHLTNEISQGKVNIKARKAHDIAKSMYESSEDFGTDTASRKAIKAYGLFKEKARESLGSKSKEYDILNKKYSLLKQMEENLQAGVTASDSTVREKAQMLLANLADTLKDESNLPVKRLFRQFFDKLELVDPKLAANHKSAILNVADKIDINQASLFSVGKMSGDTSRIVTGPLETLGVRGGIAVGKSVRLAKSLLNAPKTSLQMMANQLNTTGDASKMRLANILTEMAGSGKDRRNALMFSLTQQPAYRKQMSEMMGITDEE
jgi:hypothetical protein